jgi:hypothetical protein
MSNTFNPFAPQAQPAPGQVAPSNVPNAFAPTAPPALARPQRPIPQGLNDASANGFGAPYMLHIDGQWDFRIIGYVGVDREQAPLMGISCHITAEVVKSSTPDLVSIGSTWKFAYKYDWQRTNPDGTQGARADKDTYGTDAAMLSSFVCAVFGRTSSEGFDVRAAEEYLRKGYKDPATGQVTPPPDLTLNPLFARCMGRLGKPKARPSPTGGTEQRRFRNDMWMPVK